MFSRCHFIANTVSRLPSTSEQFSKKVFLNKKRRYICSPQNNHKRLNRGGTIAQLVEQRTENPCVAGSNPAGTTKFESSFIKKGLFLCTYT